MLDAMLLHEPADDGRWFLNGPKKFANSPDSAFKTSNVTTLAATTFVVVTFTSRPETGCGCGHPFVAAASAINC